METTAEKPFVQTERSRAKWVALSAALAILSFIAASLIAGPALSDVRSGSAADLLVAYHDDPSNAVVIPSILRALSFLFIAVPLLFLFKAARDRSPQVRGQFLGLLILGPVLLAAQFVMLSGALVDAGDKFVDQNPALVEQPDVPEGEDEDDVDEDSPRENAADDVLEDSGGISTAQVISFAGFLAFGVSLFYVGLWAMRTGLLTRFAGTFGMALGVVSAIPFFSQLGAFGSVLWMAYLSVFFARRAESRPPAWAEGRAIPWPKPGERPAEPGDGVVEGSGREVAEPALPEGEPGSEDEPAAPGETQGERRKKRKRRG